MKYATALGLMSIALVAGAVFYPALSVVFLWGATSFGVVAVGYGGLGVRVFAKSHDGRISWFAKIVLLPYLSYAWIVWHLYRLLSREDAFNQIDDDLVVGRRLLAKEIPNSFDHYVDLTAEFEDPLSIRTHESYQSFPILDAGYPTEADLDAAVEATGDGRTYIHCAQGHGRTGLFALALLIHRGRIKTASEGIELLQSLRPAIHLNGDQASFIENYLAQRQNTMSWPIHTRPESK